MAIHGREFIHTYHELADRSIEGEFLDVIADLPGSFVQYFQFGICRLFIGYYPALLFVKVQAPHLFQEAMYTLYALGIPWFAYIYRP